MEDAWAVVPTSGVVKVSSSRAGDAVSGGTETLGTSEVADFADVSLGEGSLSTFLDAFLFGSGDLEVSKAWFTAGA